MKKKSNTIERKVVNSSDLNNNANVLLEGVLLDISIDIQNELLRQLAMHGNIDDWQTDTINENVIAVFNLNKEKYITRLMQVK